jgi:hypothetical protein
MSCSIKLKNGNTSKLFNDILKDYPENIALEMYAIATSPSVINIFSQFDENSEPLYSEVSKEVTIDNGVRFSKAERKATLDKLTAMKDLIEKGTEEDPYVVKKTSKTATRVTNAIVENDFVKPFDKEDWINRTIQNELRKNSSLDEAVRRAELEKEAEVFEKKAELGTKFHKVLEIMFNENYQSLNSLTDEYGSIDYSLIFDNEIIEEIGSDYKLKNITENLFKIKSHVARKSKKGNVKLYSEVLVFDKDSNIAGTIDLVVIHDDGTVDIYDYKFAGKNIQEWNEYKFDSIKYQQGFYKTILNKQSIKVNSANIISVEMSLNEDSNISAISAPSFNNITSSITSQSKVGKDIKTIVKTDFEDEFVTTQSSAKINNLMNKLFGTNKTSLDEIEISEQNINNFWEKVKHTGFTNNVDKKRISFEVGKKDAITNEKDQKQAIKDYLIQIEQRKQSLSTELFDFIENARENKLSKTSWSFGNKSVSEEIKNKFSPIITPYITSKYPNNKGELVYEWDMIHNDDLKSLGFIMFKSNITGYVDIVNIITEPVSNKMPVQKGSSTILGNLLTKYQEEKFDLPSNTVAEAELLKAYLYLIESEVEFQVGDIVVISESSMPRRQNSKVMLDIIREIKKTKVLDDDPDFKSIYDKINNTNLNYAHLEGQKNYNKRVLTKNADRLRSESKEYYEEFANNANNKAEFRETLIERIEELNRIIKSKKNSGKFYKYYEDELFIATQTLLELYNMDRVDDSDIYKVGWFGLTLNRLTTDPKDMEQKSIKPLVTLHTKATSEISRGFIKYKKNIIKETEDLINANLSKISSNLGGYTILAFENIFEYMPNTEGKWVKTMRLRDPDNDIHIAPKQTKLKEEEVAYIKKYIKVMDDARKEKMSEYHYNKFHEDDPNRIREIPLSLASSLSRIKEGFSDEGGLKGFFKNLKAMKENTRDYFKNLLNIDMAFDNDNQYWQHKKEKRQMADAFTWLESSPYRREEKLSEGVEKFEMDLELVLDLYILNNIKVKEMNKVIPEMNAIKSMTALAKTRYFSGLDPEVQTEIEKYAEKYMDEIVFGNLASSKDEDVMKKSTMWLRNLASFGRVGLSPVSGAYNFLTNLWSTTTGAGLGILSHRIDIENYRKGMFFVGMTPSNLWSNENLVNELAFTYRVANSETFRLKEVMSLSNRGVKAFFSRWTHWMNSAPDYMHRTGMFAAEMIKEGTLKVDRLGNVTKDSAHQYIGDKMVYDEKLDDRFSEYFNPRADQSSVTYLEQESLYKSLKKELASELDGINEDGTLARAYTIMQTEDKVRAANLIYGDYNPENRSELERMAIGGLFMQFQRWKKAKKFMYLAESNKIEGDHLPYMYNENDIITNKDYNKLSEEEKTNMLNEGWQIGHMWTGKMNEGIFQTFKYMYTELTEKGLLEGTKAIRGMDDFRKRNIGQLISDLLLYAFIMYLSGSLVNILLKTIFEKSIEDALIINLLPDLPFASTGFAEDLFSSVFTNLTNVEQIPADFGKNFTIINHIDKYN